MTTTTSLTRRPAWTGKRLVTVVDFATRSHARAVAVLVLFSLLSFLPGFFQVPPVDRDEARFAQATKQMLEHHDYIDIRFQDEVRYKKPVGIYWLQAAAVNAAEALGVPEARTTIALYRIPSLLGAIGAVLATYWCALAFISRRGAVLAAMMLAGSVLLGVEARLAKTDAVLLFTVVAAMAAMARLYLDEAPAATVFRNWGLPAIFWTALAAGVLIKGPVILMVVMLAAATLAIIDRSAQWMTRLRPGAGIVLLAALVLPWFLAIFSRSGATFFTDAVGHDMLAKVAGGQESHGAPPGLYFLLFWVTFWPGAVLAGLAAPAVWKARHEHRVRFLLAWLVPSWIVFELVPTKLPHYVLPLYPAVAILIAGVMERHVLSRRPLLVLGTVWWFLVPLLLMAVAIGADIMLDRDLGLPAWPFGAAAVIFGLLAWRLYELDGAERSLLRSLLAMVLIAIAIEGIVLPSMTSLFPSVSMARVLKQASCSNPTAAAAGFGEPSLVFLAGTPTVLTDAAGAAEFLGKGGCRFAFIEARAERSFVQRAQAIRLRYAPGPRIEAIDFSIGRPVSIAVYRADAQP